ncbi:MAG: hypothetical protein ACRYGC_14245 [Janthinobacterium lividum]
MSGVHTTDAGFTDVARAGLPPDEAPSGRAAGFMHPDEVAEAAWLAGAEKRAILASWASDARAVPDAPALRQLDNGAVVRVADVLRALGRLDGRAGRAASGPGRRLARLRGRVPRRVASALWRRGPDDDDDDPPPCPAMVFRPGGGPLGGGAVVGAGLAPAA